MAGRWSQLGEILTGMGQAPARVSAFLESLDPATAAKLMQAAEAGDNRALLKAMADQTWGTSPARPQPVGPGRGETREPVSGAQWTQRPDSYVRGQVQANSEMVPPELMARIQSGDPEALNEAYAGIVRRMERAERAPRQRELPMGDQPDPFSDIPANDMEGMPPEFAPTTDAQVEQFVEAQRARKQSVEDQIRSLIPLGRSGPGVPVGDSYGGTTRGVPVGRPTGGRGGALIPAPPRGLVPASPAQGAIAEQFDMITTPGWSRPSPTQYDHGPIPQPGRGPLRLEVDHRVDNPEFDQWYEGIQQINNLPDPPNRSFDYRPFAAMAAGAGAVGAGLALMNQDTPSVTSTGGTADLASEASPPPGVMSAEDEFTDRFKRQFTDREQRRADDGSLQARILIDRLNDMRRKAGGEVPEAPQMMAEINRLLAKGNAQVRQPDFRPGDKASRYRQQAQNLINRLNDMRREAGGEVPQAKQIMAEVQKLQSMADQMRNAG